MSPSTQPAILAPNHLLTQNIKWFLSGGRQAFAPEDLTGAICCVIGPRETAISHEDHRNLQGHQTTQNFRTQYQHCIRHP